MMKNNRSFAVDLRRRRSILNLEQFNLQSFALIGMIMVIFIISALLVASGPNSNMPVGI